MGDNRTAGERRATREREAKVLELASQGKTLRAIAAELGFADQGGAWKALKRALDRIPAKAADEYRELELEKLAALEEKLFEELATRGGSAALAHAIVRVQDRRAKLLGLDAAVRVHLAGDPEGAPVGVNVEGLRDELITRLSALGALPGGAPGPGPTGGGPEGPLGPDEGRAPDAQVGLGDLGEA